MLAIKVPILPTLIILKRPKNSKNPLLELPDCNRSSNGIVDITSKKNYELDIYFIAIWYESTISSPDVSHMYDVLNLKIMSNANIKSIKESNVLLKGDLKLSGSYERSRGIMIDWYIAKIIMNESQKLLVYP